LAGSSEDLITRSKWKGREGGGEQVPRRPNEKLAETFERAYDPITAAEELAQEIALVKAEHAAHQARHKGKRLVAPLKAITLDPREAARKLNTLRIGPKSFRRLMRLSGYRNETLGRDGREPTVKEIVERLSLPAREVEALRRALPFLESLTGGKTDAEGEVYRELIDLYSDEDGPSPSDFPLPLAEAIDEQHERRFLTLLGTLTKAERDAILWDRGDDTKASRQARSVNRKRGTEKVWAEARRRGWRE
jgi:hypothetical protein